MKLPPRRKWVLRLAITVVLGLCLFLAREPILRACGRMLVVDEQANDNATIRYIWLIDAAENFGELGAAYDLAARLCSEDPSRTVLLIEAERTQLVRAQIVPSYETVSRRQLELRGVDGKAVTALDTPMSFWRAVRRLRDWLDQRPEGGVVAICGRFRSRHHRLVLDRVLAPGQAARVKLIGVSDGRFDETDWWKSRLGAKEFFAGFSSLAYAWCHGEDTLDPPTWDPDKYEAALLLGRGHKR